jgi:hypothetical protein
VCYDPGVHRIAVVACLVSLAGVGVTALAAPHQVQIRAQTRIVLDKVRLTGDGSAEVRGQLIDDLTGEGLDDQVIAIQIGDQIESATTDSEGRFRTQVSVSEGPQTVELAFRGTTQMSSANLTQLTDPARAQVALTLEVEEAPGGVTVVVRATADDQPVELPVALSVGPPADERLAPLGNQQTGKPTFVSRKAAGGPGTRRIRAAFAGDSTRQPAIAEKTVELTATSTTTMTLSANRIAFEDDLGITGKVTDEDGTPIRRAALTLASGDRRLAQGATAEDGSYRFTIEGEILGQGQWGVQVQADPGTPSIRPSRSKPEIVRVSPPEPVPVSYTIAAFLATAFAAGGFFTARAKPWRRLRRPTPPADVAANPSQDEPLEGGLVAARPGIVSTLRRPSDDSFSGVVRDTVRGRPVADALVRLRLHHTDREVTTGPDGTFSFDALGAGDWVAEVVAPGHITEKFVVAIPHRGELRGVRVDLVPVRERVFQLYRRAAEPILPEARLWGVWSPRQIVDHVRSQRPSPALADLTDFVEEVYFSPRLASEDVLPTASEQVEDAIRERAAAAK